MTQYSSTGGTATSRPGETSAAELKQSARQATQRVKDTAGESLNDVRHTLSSQASSLLNEQRTVACSKAEGFADALRQSAASIRERDPALGRFMGGAAEHVQNLASYVRGHDFQDMYRETERFARQHPAIFLGGLFVAGTMAARFLKASRERSEVDPSRGSFGDGFTPDDEFSRQGAESSREREARIASQWPQ